MKIRTNNVPREILSDHQLTAAERAQHDYLDWDAIDRGEDSASFVRYMGHAYSLSEFMRVDPDGDLAAAGWHGCAADSFFSGVLIRLVEVDHDTYAVVGRYLA